VPVNEERSPHFEAGCRFHYYVKELYVWSFIDKYIPRIEVNCEDLTPKYAIKIGDLERMLPHGMYMHKMYEHRKVSTVVRLDPTNIYMTRKNTLMEQTD
jgi:hypothetical protein